MELYIRFKILYLVKHFLNSLNINQFNIKTTFYILKTEQLIFFNTLCKCLKEILKTLIFSQSVDKFQTYIEFLKTFPILLVHLLVY